MPAALLALTPKCLLCVLAYAGIGGALGLAGPELCGAATNQSAMWASSLAWLGLATGCVTLGVLAHRRQEAAPSQEEPNPSDDPQAKSKDEPQLAQTAEPLKPDVFDWP